MYFVNARNESEPASPNNNSRMTAVSASILQNNKNDQPVGGISWSSLRQRDHAAFPSRKAHIIYRYTQQTRME